MHVINGTISSGAEEAIAADYSSLTECEKACRALALKHVGVTFQPVKYGKPFKAGKTEKIALI
jgi:hypothetical protein